MSSLGFTALHHFLVVLGRYVQVTPNSYPLFSAAHLVAKDASPENPFTRADWDAWTWAEAADNPDLVKPSFAELLAAAAEEVRQRQKTHLNSLHDAYTEQVRKHLPATHKQPDVVPFVRLLKAAGRADDALRAEQWSDHLFFRYMEMRHAVIYGNDEVIVGLRMCLEEATHKSPWHYDESWNGPTFRFHQTLPPYRKAATVMASIPAVPAPPSGVTVERRDPTQLAVLSASPAEVSMSAPGGFFEISFPVAGEQIIAAHAPEPAAEETIRLSWTAYGETHSAEVVLPAFGAA